jgi:hypothetical protein
MTGCLVQLIHLARETRIDQALGLGSLASVGG